MHVKCSQCYVENDADEPGELGRMGGRNVYTKLVMQEDIERMSPQETLLCPIHSFGLVLRET